MSKQDEWRAKGQAAARFLTRNPREQIRAGLSGAVDEFTLGLADSTLAAGGALSDALHNGNIAKFGERYGKRVAIKRAEDAYDERHYGLERGAGRVVGFGGSLLAGGAVARTAGAALRGVPEGARIAALIAKAPRLKTGVDPRGMTTLATVGGAASGVIGQGLNDLVNRQRGTARDYVAAAIGGGIGGLATLRGDPMRGGAAGGVATSVTQDLLNGRRPSIMGAVEGARGGALTAKATGAGGTYGSAAAPVRIKGKIGETLTGARLLASGEGVPLAQRRVSIGGGREAIPDWKINDRYVEAKFGPNADLTKNQRIFRRQQPDNFSVDAWSFGDVGKITGTAGVGFGSQLLDDEDYPWLPPR